MRRIGDGIQRLIQTLPQPEKDIRIRQRSLRVQAMWKDIAPAPIVEHTNSIFIKREETGKRLIVYVDDSIYAAELNALRELIKMQFKMRYQEDIAVFDILISKGVYKKNYPFKKTEETVEEQNQKIQPLPLTPEQKEWVERELEQVTNKRLKHALKRAILTDLAWKNGKAAIGSQEKEK